MKCITEFVLALKWVYTGFATSLEQYFDVGNVVIFVGHECVGFFDALNITK